MLEVERWSDARAGHACEREVPRSRHTPLTFSVFRDVQVARGQRASAAWQRLRSSRVSWVRAANGATFVN